MHFCMSIAVASHTGTFRFDRVFSSFFSNWTPLCCHLAWTIKDENGKSVEEKPFRHRHFPHNFRYRTPSLSSFLEKEKCPVAVAFRPLGRDDVRLSVVLSCVLSIRPSVSHRPWPENKNGRLRKSISQTVRGGYFSTYLFA